MAIDNKDLTEINKDGNGIVDILIRTVKIHLEEEFNKGRITGPEYSQVYLGSLNTSISQGIQFLLSKDQAAQQAKLIEAQITQTEKQTELLSKQLEIAEIQLLKEQVEKEILDKQLLLLDTQKEQTEAQTALLVQKTYTEKAQIQDVVNGQQVHGVLGKQKAIFQAQADGFVRDAEQKAAKLFADLWTVQRSTDDTFAPYTSFEVNSTNAVLDKLKQGIGVNV